MPFPTVLKTSPMFDRVKNAFKPKPKGEVLTALPDDIKIPLLAPGDNPWGIPVLDLRAATQTLRMYSTNIECAENAISYGQEDGLVFSNDTLFSEPELRVNLTYRIDRALAPGSLFLPSKMEDKWALFFHNNRLIFVRSWTRKTSIVGDLNVSVDQTVTVTAIRGKFVKEDEPPDFSRRAFDFLIRTHALRSEFPAPTLPEWQRSPKDLALACFSVFGRTAHFATSEVIDAAIPTKPLRTISQLHIAVARGDAAAVAAHLASGVPIDLIATDTLTPLHWALVRPDTQMLELLLRHGSPIDARSSEGATPLMTGCQNGSSDKIEFLLSRGADPNARDHRGFTALHRAAERGRADIVRLLLSHRANPSVEVESYTPLMFAEMHGHREVADTLRLAG